ncbi:hypothetical protein [Sphingopyxis fribergensis]
MTIFFVDDLPPDILVEREVDKVIAAGGALPRWGWPVPGPFNGATGMERVRGWQKLQIANRLGLFAWPTVCSICRHDRNIGLHAEIYSRVFTSKAVCRSCHFHIHKRFKRPDLWAAKLADFPNAEDWVRALRTVELSRSEAFAIARHPDIFAAIAALA